MSYIPTKGVNSSELMGKTIRFSWTVEVSELNDTVIVGCNMHSGRSWWEVQLVYTEMRFEYHPDDAMVSAMDVLDYIISTYSADILIQQINRKLV
jgi:hypothetical protein